MGREQEKDVEVSEEGIRREMGSYAEDEVRAKTKKQRREGTGNPREQGIMFYSICRSLISSSRKSPS